MRTNRDMHKRTDTFENRPSYRQDSRPDYRQENRQDGRQDNRHANRADLGKEITLDDVVIYIEKNKKFIDSSKTEILEVSDLNTEKRIETLQCNKSCDLENLPTNLSAIFGSVNSFRRIGAIHNVSVPADTDVSYIASILSVVFDDFITMKESEQIEMTEIFIRRFHKESRDKYKEFEYEKLGWTVKDFVNNIKNFTIGKDLLRYTSDYLCINVFVLDVENDSLIYIGEKKFIKYKKNVFVLKLGEGSYEPILSPDTRYFEYNSQIIKKLMNSRFLVERLDCDFTNEKEEFNFIVGQDDLAKYLVEEVKEDNSTYRTFDRDAPVRGWVKGVVSRNNKKPVKTKEVAKDVAKDVKDDKKVPTKTAEKTNQDNESDDLNGFGEHDEHNEDAVNDVDDVDDVDDIGDMDDMNDVDNPDIPEYDDLDDQDTPDTLEEVEADNTSSVNTKSKQKKPIAKTVTKSGAKTVTKQPVKKTTKAKQVVSDNESNHNDGTDNSDVSEDEDVKPVSKPVSKPVPKMAATKVATKTVAKAPAKAPAKALSKAPSKAPAKASAKVSAKAPAKEPAKPAPTKRSLIAYTVAQLKTLAEDNDVDITYEKNGKETTKTRAMLIADLSAAME